MKQLGEVNEGSSAAVMLSFIDEYGAPVTPTAGSYRIDTGNGVAVRATTLFTPVSSTFTISLTAEDNTIFDTALAAEPHIITLTWEYGASKDGSEECSYSVKNLLFL